MKNEDMVKTRLKWIDQYAPIDIGSGTPYTDEGPKGDSRGEHMNYSYTRKDMAMSKKRHPTGTRNGPK